MVFSPFYFTFFNSCSSSVLEHLLDTIPAERRKEKRNKNINPIIINIFSPFVKKIIKKINRICFFRYIKIKRVEKDEKILNEMYNLGVNDTKDKIIELKKYLSK